MICRKNALLSLALCAGLIPGAALAQEDNNNGGPAGPQNVPAGSHRRTNHGHFVCDVAINSNGSIATPASEANYISAAAQIGAGTYRIRFNPPCQNVQITNGWYRIVQPDLLTAGFLQLARNCGVADEPGFPNGILVRCFNSAGAQAPTSFTLSVSR